VFLIGVLLDVIVEDDDIVTEAYDEKGVGCDPAFNFDEQVVHALNALQHFSLPPCVLLTFLISVHSTDQFALIFDVFGIPLTQHYFA